MLLFIQIPGWISKLKVQTYLRSFIEHKMKQRKICLHDGHSDLPKEINNTTGKKIIFTGIQDIFAFNFNSTVYKVNEQIAVKSMFWMYQCVETQVECDEPGQKYFRPAGKCTRFPPETTPMVHWWMRKAQISVQFCWHNWQFWEALHDGGLQWLDSDFKPYIWSSLSEIATMHKFLLHQICNFGKINFADLQHSC